MNKGNDKIKKSVQTSSACDLTGFIATFYVIHANTDNVMVNITNCKDIIDNCPMLLIHWRLII